MFPRHQGLGNTAITLKQARQITGGRTPLVPIEYEEAIRALASCVELDEAKIWSDKADALAAWAKIYRDDAVALKAKQLKLHAYRRMGELAMELRPKKRPGLRGFRGGNSPGSFKLLQERGLSRQQSSNATFLAKLPQENFDQAVKQGYSPHTVRSYTQKKWPEFFDPAYNLRGFSIKNDPVEFANKLEPDRQSVCRGLILPLIEWLDRLEQALPREKK